MKLLYVDFLVLATWVWKSRSDVEHIWTAWQPNFHRVTVTKLRIV